jgi:hypothetical protein
MSNLSIAKNNGERSLPAEAITPLRGMQRLLGFDPFEIGITGKKIAATPPADKLKS